MGFDPRSARPACVGFVCLLTWLALGAASIAMAEDNRPASDSAGERRTPWTTSRVTGSPDPPPPYQIVRAFPNLKFDRPLLFARAPGTDRLFIGEQNGVLYSFVNKPDAEAELFFDLRKELTTLAQHPGAKEVEFVYGLAFHPDYPKNRTCFACYTLRASDPKVRNLPDGSRVSRFTVTDTEPPRIDPASEEILLTFLQGGHNGGDLHFGPDRMLYISTGDGEVPNPPDPRNTGQDISDLLSSILRIDVDRRDAGRPYAIPPDNPFITLEGARPEVWAFGFRNPWRMSFDRQTGELLVGDVGWELWEMVHRVERGGNYGWSATEGPQPIKPDVIGPTPIHPPLIELPHTIACSVTGGYVYRGSKFPELQGAYIFGDWETRRLWAARFEDGKLKEMPELARPTVRIVTFGEDAAGEIYFVDHDQGTIHTLERNDTSTRNEQFPTKLSETGLFADVAKHVPAAGVRPFQVNARQWRDGASAEHWVAFPNDSFARYYARGKPVPGLVSWHNFRMHFPKDAVLVRTWSLGRKRIETQLLHYDGNDWRGYTFAWRDDQTDADLVPADGDEREVSAGMQKLTWQFHSRTQCMSCHSNMSEYALAFLPEQLNRTGSDGRNQLIALMQDGFIQRTGNNEEVLPPLDDEAVARESRVPDPTDETLPLEARVRGYLHANCNHCHSEGGGGSVPLRLHFSLPADKLNALSTRPTRGDFGLTDAAIIKPGDPYASTLIFRMAKVGRDRMPHIGAELPDETGLRLIEDWIASLPRESDSGDAGASEGDEASSEQLGDPCAALAIARQIGRGKLDGAKREALLAKASQLPSGPVRDLFEGYLPPGERRSLGSIARPSAILALQGDAASGERLFWSQSMNCGKCHQVGSRGSNVGPDLSTIGRQRLPAELLESLLNPSLRIEPKFASYALQTTDGRSLTGLLVQRDEKTVVLKDGEGKEQRVVADEVDQLRPLRISLMPDNQLAGLTPQQVADLLAYLVALKGD